MDQMYYNFVNDVKDKLHEEINGRIIYEVYPDVDICVFKVTFKDFTFAYAVDRVKDRWIEEGKEGVIDIANAFKTAYKNAIMNAFFKNDQHKERDRKLRSRSYFMDLPNAKTCRTCRNQDSHNGVCEICKDNKCWTEKEITAENNCGEQMDFPDTFDEFAKVYGFKDKDEVYTNGSELIPVFRVKQWLEHISTTKNDLESDG